MDFRAALNMSSNPLILHQHLKSNAKSSHFTFFFLNKANKKYNTQGAVQPMAQCNHKESKEKNPLNRTWSGFTENTHN